LQIPGAEVVNGWTILQVPAFAEAYDALVEKVRELKAKHPDTYQKKPPTKRLAAINKLALDVIPQDPASEKFRQGTTLGPQYRHWRRAKFFQQYRLFFRYTESSRIIILG
jgi:toxin YhaV